MWLKDIDALNEAIWAVNRLDEIIEIDKLRERAQEAEMLLREVQPFCPQIEKNMISEFFRK